ncbi:hypothetical protein SMH99_27030 [Spiroplasma poulsonii]|nr:hypothetical protein SMH99_27030 [Spiroplasma poulsonii]
MRWCWWTTLWFWFFSASLVDQMRQNELITARLDNGTMEPIRAITEYDNIDELEATNIWKNRKMTR